MPSSIVSYIMKCELDRIILGLKSVPCASKVEMCTRVPFLESKGILRYLGGRFPETTSAVDDNGRTALHYAATIKDNGHFYNMLVQMGANPKAMDKTGHTAEFYLNHEEAYSILTHADLLKGFGANENLAEDMLNDQDPRPNSQVEIPLFRTEEGRYLASTLGDPLIKALTEVANTRPSDPVLFLAEYLHDISKQKKIPAKTVVEKSPKMDFSRIDSPTTEEMPPNSNVSEAAANSDDRDEHGQSVLHFACARSHGRNALIQLIEETGVSLAYRDELYRTARDVSMQATQPENTREIDKYVLGLAARGELDMLVHLANEGYDHIVDVHEDESIAEIARSRGHAELGAFLDNIPEFEAKREKLHRAIRSGDLDEVKRIVDTADGQRLALAKNYFGRSALHIAVLKEREDIVHYLATKIKAALRLGDNLERTALHYAMGVNMVETLSRILIKNGAKRVLKDLKGRQPSYYFMNKSDITRLQEEEEEDEL